MYGLEGTHLERLWDNSMGLKVPSCGVFQKSMGNVSISKITCLFYVALENKLLPRSAAVLSSLTEQPNMFLFSNVDHLHEKRNKNPIT